MQFLEKHTSEIESLIQEGTQESFTYAALRCRLALELVCYHRLRVAHDYISAKDLRRWQPRDVVNRLIQDVDPKIAKGFTLSIGKEPIKGSPVALAREDFEKFEYVELGRQVGFDSNKLGRIWNGLGNFLHVRKPDSSKADLAVFAPIETMKRKVEEALAMLKDLQRGTLVSVGFGPTVTFECHCGSKNKRSLDLLTDGQTVSCIDPECPERWIVRKNGDDIEFDPRTMVATCKCGHANPLPEQVLLRLERGRHLKFLCQSCREENLVVWKLMSARLPPPVAADDQKA